MHDLDRRIANLSPAKRALLEQKLQQRAIADRAESIPPLVTELDNSLLSCSQQRMWLLDRLEPGNPAYNRPANLKLSGYVDRQILGRSLNEILRRHHVLRATFPSIDGQPQQSIEPEVTLDLAWIDLSELVESARSAQLQDLLIRSAHCKFVLDRDLLVKAILVKLNPLEHILLLTFHHIIFDGWSMGVLITELAAIYQAFAANKSSPLPELASQYTDFIHWQQQQLSVDRLQPHLNYWQQQLAGKLPILELPTDYPRPLQQTYRGAKHTLVLDSQVSNDLKELSQREDVTLFMLLLAAFQTLLYRYTGETDSIVGCPISGRDRIETESLIGVFINTLVLRTQLDPEISFSELLTRVRQVAVDAYAHQAFPFERLIETINPDRHLSHSPLFQVFFQLRNLPPVAPELSIISIEEFNSDPQVAPFDLSLDISVAATGLTCAFTYNTDLFDASTIERMAGQFQTLLTGIVADPQQQLSRLPLLADKDRVLLGELHPTQKNYYQTQCPHQLFEAQVDRTPDAVAVTYGEERLTYRELNERANRLAHRLQSLGVKAETLVGLSIERSLEMVVGILGILKAGGAYVPLDPTYPQDRLAYMLEDSQVPVLVTMERLAGSFGDYSGTVVGIDGNLSEHSVQNPVSDVTPDHLIYIIYTSGSTGNPKGVRVTHANVGRLFAATEDWYHFDASDVWTLFHSYAFDFSVWELWGALIYGSKLVVVPFEISRSPQDFYELLVREKVTVLNQTPSAFGQLIHAAVDNSNKQLNQSAQLNLRWVIFGGEVLDLYSLKPWFELFGDRTPQLVNMYGITETTVHVTYRPIDSSDLAGGSVIGQPIPDLELYILDPHSRQPVGIGIAGEMYVGGAGVARGYLNRPELTAERFISHPFRPESGERLYKTGDLARYLANGDIEYLGRLDNQVKIRGFRIELGEIDAAISRHPSVKQIVTLARDNNTGTKQLVAYLVPHPESTPTIAELRSSLKHQLPDYMIPAAFIMLESLPLTPNGKIDTKALLQIEAADRQPATTQVSAQTPIQTLLAGIWAEVLGIKQVGIHDNFFELGGDSILSIQIIARAHRVNLQLTPKYLFQHQTIAELAEVATFTPTVAAVNLEPIAGVIPLTPIQHWFVEQNLPEAHHFNQSFLLEIAPEITPELWESALKEVICHHDAFRLRSIPDGDTWQLHSTADRNCEIFSRIDLSPIDTNHQSTAIEATANRLQASLNIAEGPIMRVALFDLGNHQPYRLLFIVHHVAIDGISWRILLEDVAMAYRQLSQGEAVRLPAKTTSYQYWSERLTRYARSPEAVAELDFWSNQIDAQIVPLPADYHAEIAQHQHLYTDKITVSLAAERTTALLQEVPAAYNTQINDVLLTALTHSFARWTGQNSLLVDLEGHGREDLFADVNLSRTVGWFTTIFPVLLKLDGSGLLDKSLKSIKERLRHIPNRGIGYGILRYLHEDASVRHQLQQLPQAQVSFNYLGRFDRMLSEFPILGLARESGGSPRSLAGNCTHLLAIVGFVADGKLQFNWTYNTTIHHRDTIERLARDFMESLEAIIDLCLDPQAGGYTPTDFPEAELSQSELDRLVAALSPRAKIESIYPLSPMQAGILFHSLFASNSGAYCEQSMFAVSGNLNVAALKQAFHSVVARHSILRTVFGWKHHQRPLQVVSSSVDLPWRSYDWRSLNPEQWERELEALLAQERLQGFALDRSPLMQCTLIHRSDRDYQFIWSHHHLLLDGWSLRILMQEIWTLYAAFDRGENLQLAVADPYRNYIVWLQQQDSSAAERFWRSQLAGFLAPTPVTIDRAVPVLPAGQDIYAEMDLKLSVAFTDKLKNFTRQHHLTSNTLVQAVWALLLGRYSGTADVVFGATVSGRNPTLRGVESMVGVFINTLPVRVQIAAETEVLAWLKQLQQQQVDREQYAYSSLVDIQGWSDVPRGLPLFDSIVIFANYPVDVATNIQTVEISDFHVRERNNYPLTVDIKTDLELSIQIGYDPTKFTDDSISQMLGHLQTLLLGIIANPSGKVCELPLLTATERDRLLVEWNSTQADYSHDRCFYQLFETQAAQTPNAIAVVCGDRELTYGELNARSNQLARHLQGLGAKPDALVGIYIERSVEMLVGLLGILKSGAAYVPLDPSYPPERLNYMVMDAGVEIIVTQQALLTSLPAAATRVICLDADRAAIDRHDKSNLPPQATPDDLAYVIYTSGSTGMPKGVQICHRSVTNFLASMSRTPGLTATDTLLSVTTISFDIAVLELYLPLVVGAKIVLASREISMDGNRLLRLLAQSRATMMQATPSTWQLLLAAGWVDKSPLKILCGGEALSPALAARLLARGESVWNLYGPTEATVWATIDRVDDPNAISIGRPIDNIRTYILDPYLQPVPIGIPGELYIGGDCLARAYLDRPDLTAANFIADPFSTDPAARLYKTGDLVKYLPDGKIEYLSRLDRLVKLRGVRIELGEIEAILTQHPDLHSAIASVREDTPGDCRLVAYIIPEACASSNDDRQQLPPQISDVRDFLARKLPRQMIPSAWVILSEFPLTANGKIDRLALPAPDGNYTNAPTQHVAPRNSIETQLAAIWQQALGIEEISIIDNFFDLGGHSLLAIGIFAEIERLWGQNLPVTTLFQHPTIDELATIIAAGMANKHCNLAATTWQSLVTIKQGCSSQPPVFFIHDVSGSVLFYRQIVDCIQTERTCYAVQPYGMDGRTPPIASIPEMASNYIRDILAVQPEGAYYLCGYSFGSFVAFEIARQLHDSGKEVKLLGIIDTSAPRLAGADDRPMLVRPIEAPKNYSRLAKFLRMGWQERIDYLSHGFRNHRTLGKLRTPYRFYLRYLKRSLAELGGIDVYDTNDRALYDYAAPSTYPGSATLFYSDAKLPQLATAPTLYWDRVVTGGIELHAIPNSNHATIILDPHVKLLGEKLTFILDRH